MKIDSNLKRLVKIIEAQSERNSDISTKRKPPAAPLPQPHILAIKNYLLEPYEHGFWDLHATWNTTSSLAKFLAYELKTLAEINIEKEFSTTSLILALRNIPEEKQEELLRISSRLSSINALFLAVKESSENIEPTKVSERDNWIEKIKLSNVAEKFPEAVRIFAEKIYFEGFKTSIGGAGPHQIKAGPITLLEAPRTSDTLRVAATQRETLVALQDFYLAIGVIENPSIRRVFAPDEDLFRPYFPLVSCVLPNLVLDSQISRLFEQSLAYYEDDDFQHCISSLGLIAEDYLQRIYTTVLREALPGGLTLGQTVERLHKRVDELMPQPKLTPRTPDPIYEKIKLLDNTPGSEAIKSILRDLVGLLIDDRNYHVKRIEEFTKINARRSIFPPKITDRLNELLKWRNAASHNSRIPLGVHEADRTLFCLIGVIAWWQDRLEKIDWSHERIKVVENLIHDAQCR